MQRFSIIAAVLLLAGCQGAGDDAGFATQGLGEPTIRIGVVPATSSVSIGSKSTFAVRNKTTGVTLVSGSNASATVSLGPVSSMEVWIDGVKSYSAASTSSISPWLYASPGKWHSIQVRAYDAKQNMFVSTTIKIYVVS